MEHDSPQLYARGREASSTFAQNPSKSLKIFAISMEIPKLPEISRNCCDRGTYGTVVRAQTRFNRLHERVFRLNRIDRRNSA